MGSMVGDILAEQSPRQLLVVRAKLYQLLINCIPASVIMKARFWHTGTLQGGPGDRGTGGGGGLAMSLWRVCVCDQATAGL